MSWTYSTELHRLETVDRLAQRFIEALRGLIADCLSLEMAGSAASGDISTKRVVESL